MAETPPIVFFDGVCGLCNRLVDVLLRIDRHEMLRFAPLQGMTASEKLSTKFRGRLNTILFLDETGETERSEAVIRLFEQLGGGWKAAALFRVCPPRLRNKVYEYVANHRYAWFGRRETCRIPTAAERARFLP